MAPQAKPPAVRGFWGRAPNSIINMMRRYDTECRQVLRTARTQTVQSEKTCCSQMAPQAKPPAGRGFGGSAPNYSKQNLDKDLML